MKKPKKAKRMLKKNMRKKVPHTNHVLIDKLKKKIDKIKHHLKKVHADVKSMVRLKQIEYHLNSILKRKKKK